MGGSCTGCVDSKGTATLWSSSLPMVRAPPKKKEKLFERIAWFKSEKSRREGEREELKENMSPSAGWEVFVLGFGGPRPLLTTDLGLYSLAAAGQAVPKTLALLPP
eukprot:3936669-Rhodomonas_salina.1